MTQPTILHIAVPTPLRRTFDYLLPEGVDLSKLKPGVRVQVPFQKRTLTGIYLGSSHTSSVPLNKLRPILAQLDDEPILPNAILQLCQWAADYYHYPIGEVISAALPQALRQGKPPTPLKKKMAHPTTELKPPLPLNAQQAAALSAIQEHDHTFQVLLLDGVTGSGKTEVYLQAIDAVVARHQQVLVLVPEIGLTPQTIQRFCERFAVPIVVMHSKMTEKQRLTSWLQAKSGEARIIIGTRSAVFTPCADLGLIIIDEEHDLSFKQQEGFRYHARDLAVMRAHFHGIPIVLGSATPSLETLQNAKVGRFKHLTLSERAGGALLPQYHVFDIRNAQLEQGLSKELLNAMQQHLNNGEQVMLFLNRRGYAPILMCHACGWMAHCKRCDMRMTYHQQAAKLHCHHCDTQKRVPKQCENCGSPDLQAIGQGTERIESVLQQRFPAYSIARIDRDSTKKKGSMETMLDHIQTGEHQILIGTQMLAKGHHFPNVTLVGIVDADGGFFSGDFRALEKMGQLLLQVAGRAGRAEKPGRVIVQTHHPDHPLLYQLLNESYQKFAATLLQERKQIQLPPYAYFALFRAEAHKLEDATQFLNEIKKGLPSTQGKVQVWGPVSAPIARRAGRHRMQLLLQSAQRPALQLFLKQLLPQVELLSTKQRVRWSLDIDPLEMV